MSPRFGLSLSNFRRFEPILQAAVLSFPKPVEVDWTKSDLRYTTYVSRIRDAIKWVKEQNGYQVQLNWLRSADDIARLCALEVRGHPSNPSKLVIGDHDSIKPPPQASFMGNPEVADLVSRYSTTLPTPQTSTGHQNLTSPSLMLATSVDPMVLERAVKAYAELASMKVEGLQKFHIRKENLTVDKEKILKLTLETYCDGYDVAVHDAEGEFVIF